MKKVVRRSVSILLSMLMVVSMLTVGVISASAASTDENALGAASIALPTYADPASGKVRTYLKINTTGIGWYQNSLSAADYRAYCWIASNTSVYNSTWPGQTLAATSIAGGFYADIDQSKAFDAVIYSTTKWTKDDKQTNDIKDFKTHYNYVYYIPSMVYSNKQSGSWKNIVQTPTVSAGNTSLMEGETTTLSLSATSEIGAVCSGISFYIYEDGTLIGSINGTKSGSTNTYTANYSLTAANLSIGTHTYTVKATDGFAVKQQNSAAITVSGGGIAVPTNLKLEATANGNIVKGTGASSAPLMYYSGKTASLTASATAPEGATLEYAFKDTIVQPTDADFSASAVKTFSDDNTSVAKKRFVYVRAVVDGEKSDPVSLSYYTQCLAPGVKITSTFPDGVAEKTDFDLDLSLTDVFPQADYGDAVVTVKEGDTILGTATVPQASIAADGTANATVTCNLEGFGGHTLTASVTYEGVTSANATATIKVVDPNAKTDTVGQLADTTVIYVDTTNISGVFETSTPYIHVWDDNGHVLTRDKDPRTAMTAVPGVANLYYFKPTAAQEAAIGTNTLNVVFLKGSVWNEIRRFTLPAKSQILVNSLTSSTMGRVDITPKLTLKSISYSDNMKQNTEYQLSLNADGGLPKTRPAVSYKLSVTATLEGGSPVTIVNNKTFSYSVSGSSYSFNWKPTKMGTYTLNYTLSDSAGIDSVSYAKTVKVTGLLPPAVTGITPATGSAFSVNQPFDVVVGTDAAPEGATYYYQFSGTGVKTADQEAGTNNTITIDTTEEMVTGPNSITVQVWAQNSEGDKSSIVERTIDFTVEYTQTQLDYKQLKEKTAVYSAAITAAMEQYCVPADWADYQAKLSAAQALITATPDLPPYDVTNDEFAAQLTALDTAVQTLAGSASYPTADFYVGSQWYHTSGTSTAWDRTDIKITTLPDDYIGPMLLQQFAGEIDEVKSTALNPGNKTTLSDGSQIHMYKVTGVPAGAQFVLSDTAGFIFPDEGLIADQGKTYYIHKPNSQNEIAVIEAMSIESFTADVYEVEQGDPVTLTAVDKVLGGGMTTAVGAAITQSFTLEDGTAVTLANGVWDTTDVVPGTYKIHVTQTDANGIVIKSSLFVTINVKAPTVYTAPTVLSAAADADTYYDSDNIVLTAAASGATYWLGTETSADAKDYDTLEGATYSYELYNGAEKINETTGLAGTNVTFTISGVTEGSEYSFTVKAYPTLSKGSAVSTSDQIVRNVLPLVVWNTAAQAFEIQKDSAAVTDIFANNGVYTLAVDGVTATAHGADTAITYKYSLTNKNTSAVDVLPDDSWTPAAGSYTITPMAVINYGGNEYTQELAPVEVTVKANLLSDPKLTGKMDGITFNTTEKGTFDMKNYPADNPSKGVFLFNASASVAEPADASAAVSYSYTLKEDESAPVAITDTDGDDSTLTFNINDKCKMGSLYVLTVSAQVTASGITQTTTKTYTFAITDSSKLVTIFFGGPANWGDKIKYVVYNDADQTKLEGTLVGTFETTDQTAGLTSVNYDIYTIKVPAGQEFRIANKVVFDETQIKDGPGLYMAGEGMLYYIYGKSNVNYAYEVPATTLLDFKASAVDGTSITETADLYAPLGGTVTFKNTLSNQYASYKTPVRVDYYIGAQKVASSADASSTTITTDFVLNAAAAGIDFEIGGSYPVRAVVTEGNYGITYENAVTLKVTAPTSELFTTYFMLTNEMMNDADNPWTAEGLKWEAINASTGNPEVMKMGAAPIDIKPDTTVNGIHYDIDGTIFKVTYHGNISQIRIFMDGQGTGNATDGYNKRSTRYLDVLSGKMSEKVYYITDYSKYSASPTIANDAEGWYNLKYTATFQYPKETVRFYQQGSALTQDQLNPENSVTKSMELYVSANLSKVYPRVDSRYNEYVWPAAGTGVLLEDTAAIIPTTVNTKKYSLTLVNTPEEATGVEVSAGTVNSNIEIRSISGKPIDGVDPDVTYYVYQEQNKFSAQIEYMYGVRITAPLTSKDQNNNNCDFVGWYDLDKKQFVSYQPRFATIITNTLKLMPVYSDNTTLNILQPQAVIDGVTYETYMQGEIDMVKMVFALRVADPGKGYSNLRFYMQKAIKSGNEMPQDSEWLAPLELTAAMNKDKRVNVNLRGEVYSGGVLDSTRYYMRAYVEFNDAEGNPQRVYSNIEMASPELMASV